MSHHNHRMKRIITMTGANPFPIDRAIAATIAWANEDDTSGFHGLDLGPDDNVLMVATTMATDAERERAQRWLSAIARVHAKRSRHRAEGKPRPLATPPVRRQVQSWLIPLQGAYVVGPALGRDGLDFRLIPSGKFLKATPVTWAALAAAALMGPGWRLIQCSRCGKFKATTGRGHPSKWCGVRCKDAMGKVAERRRDTAERAAVKQAAARRARKRA